MKVYFASKYNVKSTYSNGGKCSTVSKMRGRTPTNKLVSPLAKRGDHLQLNIQNGFIILEHTAQ
jgi:hypothetical protein